MSEIFFLLTMKNSSVCLFLAIFFKYSLTYSFIYLQLKFVKKSVKFCGIYIYLYLTYSSIVFIYYKLNFVARFYMVFFQC